MSARPAHLSPDDDGGRDPERPAEYGGGEDDQGKRRLTRADHPDELRGTRVHGGENDKHDEQRDEHTGGGVQAGAACLAGESGPTGLERRSGTWSGRRYVGCRSFKRRWFGGCGGHLLLSESEPSLCRRSVEKSRSVHLGLVGCRCSDRSVGCGGERCELDDSCCSAEDEGGAGKLAEQAALGAVSEVQVGADA